MARVMHLEGVAGLTSALIGRAELEEVVQPWQGGRLSVLTAGAIPPNPSELLGSAAMATLVGDFRSLYDVVIIDSPPLLPVADASILGRLVDGVILTVGADVVQKRQVEVALQHLEVAGVPVLGVILNRVSSYPDADGASWYRYSYSTTVQP